MKKVCRFLKDFAIIAYILIIIFVTICLLSYNDYKVTVFGSKTIVPIIDEDLEPDYSKGDLLVIEKNDFSDISIGDTIFFYRTVAGETTINYAKVEGIEPVTDTEYTFTVKKDEQGEYKFSSSYFIGKSETTSVIPGVGIVLSILESKWGFLFLGVFPSLIAFLYTIYSIILEFNNTDGEEEKSTKKKSSKNKKSDSVEKKENLKEEKNDNKETEKLEENSEDKKNKEAKKEERNENDKTESDKKEENNNAVEERESEETLEIVNNSKDEKDDEEKENKIENKDNETKTKIEEKENKTEDLNERHKNTHKQLTEEEKRALIEEKMKTMSKEEKKALLEAKLKSMSPEEKKALIEAKKKKLEADKNKK